MANLSQQKRQRMLDFLETIKSNNPNEATRIAINEIENELTEKKYGLVWEKHEENVDVQMRGNVPVFSEIKDREIVGLPESNDFNFLLEGDNLHSLKLLEKTHKGRIDVIYIDPPYNTGNNDFIYDDVMIAKEDDYRHSKWISFMAERLKHAQKLLTKDGVLVISIGYQEVDNLMLLCNEMFADKQVVCTTVQTSGGKPNGGFNISHEHIIFVTPFDFLPNVSEGARNEYSSPYHGMNLATFNQVQRPNQAYPIFVDANQNIMGYGKSLQERVDDGSYTGDLADFVYDYSEAPEGTVAVFPVTTKGDPCVWRLIGKRMISDWTKGYIRVVPINSKNTNNKYTIQYLSGGVISKIESGELEVFKPSEDCPTLEVKEYKTAGSSIPTIWLDKSYYTTNGSNQIKNILGSKEFPYPKPLELIMEILNRVTKPDSVILDYFSGSGTTGQAVMEMNRLDEGNRKFILCTNNQNNICEKITYERLKRVIQGYDYTGKLEDVLYKKAIALRELSSAETFVKEAEKVAEENEPVYKKVTTKFKDGVLQVIGTQDTTDGVEGIPANLKYYKTDFIPKTSEDEFYSVGDELLNYIKEMIQLEYGISLDNEEYALLLTDEDADELEKNDERLSKCKAVYVSTSVFLTKEQRNKFGKLSLISVPDYYFEEELREVGEL